MLLRHIRYFLAVAEHRNFTRAAEALHVSQPTLSQQIRQLEDTLGTQLLDRSGRTVQLTDAGVAWMKYAKLALQDLDAGARAIHDVAELSRGHLRLAITPTFTAYVVGPLVQRFYRMYPGITIDVQELTQDHMEALLADDMLDVGVAFDPALTADIESRPIFRETLGLMVGKDHPRGARRKALTSAELVREPLILLNRSFATRQHIDRYFDQHGIRPNVAIEANSIGAVVQVVRRGLIATILPEQIALEQQLHTVQLEPLIPTRHAAILQRKHAYRSAAATAFIELFLAHFQTD